MNRKKQPPEDWADRRRRERGNRVQFIKQEWPSVSLITVELEFPYSKLETEVHLGADDKAFFDYPCPNECRQGGFELTEQIANMVRAKEKERSDELVCRGMEKDGRLNCGLKLEYRITVRYKT
jgi:hypothetical protein